MPAPCLLLKNEQGALPLTAQLPQGDRVTSCIVTLDGRVIAEASGLPEQLRLTLPEGTAHRAALNVTVQTAQGCCLGLSRSIQVLPAAAEPVLQLTGTALKKAFPRTENCRVYQEEDAIRLRITGGSSEFRMEMMPLKAGQQAWAVVKVPQAGAHWGVELYVNNLGRAVSVLPQWQRTGEYLIPLDGVLQAEGLEEANVRVVFTLSSGGTGEVVVEELSIHTTTE